MTVYFSNSECSYNNMLFPGFFNPFKLKKKTIYTYIYMNKKICFIKKKLWSEKEI